MSREPDIAELVILTELVQTITTDQAWFYSILPEKNSADSCSFYIDERKINTDIIEEMELLFNKKVLLKPIPSESIKIHLNKYYRKDSSQTDQQQPLLDGGSDNFLNRIINEANQLGSSDIHLEAFEEKCRIRIRIDGKLIEKFIIKPKDYPSIVNKIKIQANLDIAEKRLPQDGRIFFSNEEAGFDVRVSIIPSMFGEKIVLRLLSRSSVNIEISELGFSQKQLESYKDTLKKPSGIILISGPTGSGKTTTLYATLKLLNKVSVNILTIEDPIEYTLEGINQVQLKEGIGLGFPQALRTFLRQDPDIIMLGEIRDSETAQMAIRAALTGHLVLSTIHTNSAWGTVTRLLDMGVPSYLLAGTLNTCIAQRLVRLLCPKCKEKVSVEKALALSQYYPTDSFHFIPIGCEHCHYTGYKGRIALFELITIDDELVDKIRRNDLEVKDLLFKKKIVKLRDSAIKLVSQGLTNHEEVYPILNSEY